uniref:Agmatinase n=1 Tax=Chromera velia CCMP2878 TaxID=1169474 RepID=A0A0G4GBN9_9ALVE|eukprot:Cvel_21158.t1-p1 / transcript=Cvel_21158.t1 / gene=Cvel_21158 / organism=Chromera_velia_CCMP2878 / gene_product=Agmatinase, mitochondrial, putative / transcript_product=Agmatinase, mitochondrial, putative / location=Cvel_scaffold1962:19063-19800(-) / protein_length=246 / sequence_SO=supercontig / SO=protein_coding / is_pseudo=false
MFWRQNPFDHMKIDDLGDIAINTYNVKKSVGIIENRIASVAGEGAIPLCLGGDHTVTYGTLRGLKEKHGSVTLIHLDAHTDTNDDSFGEKITHGTPIRRAFEDGLISRAFQIGLRGTGYFDSDWDWSTDQGFEVLPAWDILNMSNERFVQRITEMAGSIGSHENVYVSLDIDVCDPAYAPGTGTPETGGLSPFHVLHVIRALKGKRIVGADVVEVSPPYDAPANVTAVLGANFAYELLCVMRKLRG